MKFLIILTLSLSYIFAIIDINSATAQELTSLKGIGIKKANNIIIYRKLHKCFKTINELTNVKGIGKITLEKNIKNLKIKPCNNNLKKVEKSLKK